MATARVVTVHVASVHGLQQDDPNVFADPYLALTVGKHSRKSSVKRKTQDPCFDESFDFYPDDSASASLQVQVLDKARAKDSNLLSECTVPLAEALLEAQEQQRMASVQREVKVVEKKEERSCSSVELA